MSLLTEKYANILDHVIKDNSIVKSSENQDAIKKEYKTYSEMAGRIFLHDTFTDQLLKVLDKCGFLYTIEDPYCYLNYSNVIYRTLPLLGKAIRLRQTFIGTVNMTVNRVKGGQQINTVIDFMMNDIPIIQSGNITEEGVGFNCVLNTLVMNCDVHGTCFLQPRYNSKLQVDAIIVYNPKYFRFSRDENGNKELYYGNTKVDIDSLYIFKLGTVTGYDWGTPLIYGDKLMADSIVKLLHAQVNGLLRNLNPFLLTMISINENTYLALSAEERKTLGENISDLESNVAKASNKAMNGQSMHMISSLPSIDSVNSVQLGSDIKVIDSKTLFTLIDVLCTGLEVPIQLMINSSGSMNTDQSKVAALLMESWANEYARPIVLPKLKSLAWEIMASYGITVNKKDVNIEILKNETLINGLVAPDNKNNNPVA